MSGKEVDRTEAATVAREIVLKAKENRTLKKLTPKSIRAEVEEKLSLPKDALVVHKSFLAEVIKAAIQEDTSNNGDDALEVGPSSKQMVKSTTEVTDRNKSNGENGASAPTSIARSTLSEAQANSSVDREFAISKEPRTETKINKGESPMAESDMSSLVDEPPKKKRKKSVKSGEHYKKDKPKDGSTSKEDGKQQDRSGSDMSVLDDVAVKKKQNSKKDRKKDTTSKPLNKDEESIKKLKSFVVACGVRKAWAKEFKDCPDSRSQIARLRAILTDLGMPARPSMSEARKIKERRELMQDVEAALEFEMKAGAPSKDAKNGSRSTNADSSEESEPSARRPKVSAARSIMAFLEDQSD